MACDRITGHIAGAAASLSGELFFSAPPVRRLPAILRIHLWGVHEKNAHHLIARFYVRHLR